jgi:hypothetical protein
MLLVAAAGSLLAIPALPASQAAAQSWYGGRGYSNDYRRDVRRAQRECRRDLRRADNRREYRRELRDCRRDLRRAGQRGYGNHYGWYGRDNGRYYWDGFNWRRRW